MTDIAPFDVSGPLPGPGITVLEASAGTGKTFTIAALVTRLVAEGMPIGRILAVTFTRMATGELRERVRAQMVASEDALGRKVTAGTAPDPSDPVSTFLAGAPPEEVAVRHRRLAEALSDFDAATITTTHGFCQLVLAGLGVAGEVAAGATLLEDPRDLVEEVVDDLYVRGIMHFGELRFPPAEAQRIARAAMTNPDAPVEPADAERGSTPGMRRRIALGVRQEVGRRLLDANLLTYDDLLLRLAGTLEDAERGEAACRRLRDSYRAVLVDEFQDTDPVQWKVVQRAFGGGDTTLVLIGDPKQAVYAFRGADVHAYLEAARMGARRYTLVDNWRSDSSLLSALDALFDPLRFGHPDIPFRRVRATAAHERPGLEAAPESTALRLRVLDSGAGVEVTPKAGTVQVGAAREWVAADVAGDVAALLGSGARLVRWSPAGERLDEAPVGAGDVAVLVSTNRQAAMVHRALRAAGVPSVMAGTESVFRTDAARHWLRLLEALEQPASRARAVAVSVTPFFDFDAAAVAAADEARWEEVHAHLHRWAEVLRRRGVASLVRAVTAAQRLPRRILGTDGGERTLTDLVHVGQLLHAEGISGQRGTPALRAWLARRVEEREPDGTEAEERSRRLDSDSDAVQVLTVHRAKGLEFPVVYCPFLWDPVGRSDRGDPVTFHDGGPGGGRLRLDVGGRDGPGYMAHFRSHEEEEAGEALRHLYVALTRARHQVVVHWARGWQCQRTALGRLLMHRDVEGNVPAAVKGDDPTDAEVVARLDRLVRLAPGCVVVEKWGKPASATWAAPAQEAGGDLELATLDRTLVLRWRRTSYSGITAVAHDEAVGSEPEEPGTSDEPARPEVVTAAAITGRSTAPATGAVEASLRQVASPMAWVPAGAEVGTFVHHVLEEVDFASDDLEGDLTAAIGAGRTRPAVDLGEDGSVPAALARALASAISTPLGPLVGDLRLRDVRRSDRLDELGFELPLAGGDRPSGEVLMGDVAALVAAHTGDGGPLAGYARRLADPALASHLRGYLTGSLDLVLRVAAPDGAPRFYVADYKTNWLGGEPGDLTAWHYRPAALDVEMQRAHYPLQAVLYLVALHRYLRWRLPGYRPADHLGGVLYLFLRGMTGADVPRVDGHPCGVFAWAAPADLVTGLSDLFDAGSPAGGRP
ncbi:MAG TPA: UvrD-helicase domain-containing protein [Acidimicrobiales bacterium]|nr:UvrD-helicase domain-containing protein [Acidimicrobiales bacterium]